MPSPAWRRKKPVVAVMRGTAASAGYMVALPAARIWAREATLTGSIGVLLETPEFSGLMDKLGVQATVLVSGPLKDQPSFTHPLSPAGRTVLQELVQDMYGTFVGMVADSRHMDAARVRELADGRAYTGKQAKALGLIDAIGGEPDARDWLAAERQIPRDTPVHDLAATNWAERTFGAQGLADGLAGLAADVISRVTLRQTGQFDGAMALWQPQNAGR